MVAVVASFTGTTFAGSATQASQPGDIFVALAWRNGSSTPPSLPSGWTALNTSFSAGGTARGARFAYKRSNAITSTTDIASTWPNATIVLIIQLRGDSNKSISLGTLVGAVGNGVTATPGYPAITLIGGAAQDKCVLSLVGCTSNTTDIDTVVPTSSTLVRSHSDASNEIAAFLSSAVSSWSLNSPTINASVPWATGCFEVFQYTPVNYWDDFDRANANLGASLAATGTNGGWNWIDSTGGVPSAATIASNKLNANTADANGYIFSVPDILHKDQFVEWTIDAITANSNFFDLRYTDISNKVSVRQTGTSVEIYRRVATTYTSIHSVNYSLVAGDVVRLEAREDSVFLFKNGALQSGFPLAIGAILNGTKVGLNPRTAAYTGWARDIKFGSITPPYVAPTGGKAKVWSGSAWVEKPAKVWTGSAWVEKPVKVWNGSSWVVS